MPYTSTSHWILHQNQIIGADTNMALHAQLHRAKQQQLQTLFESFLLYCHQLSKADLLYNHALKYKIEMMNTTYKK